jgi:hypothetical protein
MIRKTTRLGITYTLTAVLFLTLTGIAEGSIINPNPPPTSPSSPSQPSQGCNHHGSSSDHHGCGFSCWQCLSWFF